MDSASHNDIVGDKPQCQTDGNVSVLHKAISRAISQHLMMGLSTEDMHCVNWMGRIKVTRPISTIW